MNSQMVCGWLFPSEETAQKIEFHQFSTQIQHTPKQPCMDKQRGSILEGRKKQKDNMAGCPSQPPIMFPRPCKPRDVFAAMRAQPTRVH